MAARREDTAPELKDFQIGSNNWETGEATNSMFAQKTYPISTLGKQVRLPTPMFMETIFTHTTKFSIKDTDKWTNMSFGNLLALAHAVGNKSRGSRECTYAYRFGCYKQHFCSQFSPQIEGSQIENALRHTDFVATSSTSAPCFHPQIEGSQFTMSFGNSTLQDLSLLGAKFDAELQIPNAVLSKSTSSQFEPITPEKTNKAEYRQESAMKDLSIVEVPAGEDAQENRITRDGVMELHEKKEKSHLVIDQLCAATSTQLQENYKPDKGGTEEADLSKTPQQKTRRKKHRPKVIIEGQHKSTPKSNAEKPTVPQETTRVKRKRKAPRHTRRSCRRSLNFNSDGQVRDESSSYCPSSYCDSELQTENFNAQDQSRTVQCRQGMEVMMEKNDMDTPHELTSSMNQVQEDYLSRPEQHSPSHSPSTNMDPLKDEHMLSDQIVCTRGKCQIVFSDVTHDKEANTVQVRMNPDGQRTPKSPSDSICSSTCLTPERQVRGLKRQNMGTTAEAELCNRYETGTFYNSLQAYLPIFSQNADKNDGTPTLHFPAIYKKKRTEKGHNIVLPACSTQHSCTKLFASITNQGSSGAQCQVTNLLMNNRATDGTQNGRQVFEDLLALGPTERIKKRRSKGPTRLRDLASLLEICKELPSSPGRAATTSRMKQDIEILHEPHTCMEALVADTRSTMTTKKRSKRSMLINSTVQNLYNHQKSGTISIGPPLALTWKCMSPVDSIIEQLNQLDLNAESSQASAERQNVFMAYHTHYQEQHALVPFQRCGAVIPFDSSFDQVRRRRPRPKVDLDDETTRVWKLLLENINSEGIDGTDEEKTKWWEEERRVFNGRADSFIARMHLVQGDRRFSPWKGSVVDSVVGVFLTQNVSDHLSSSAFMSLAAQFPSSTKIKEPEVCVLDPDGAFALNEEILNQSVCGEDSKMLQDFEDDSIREVNSVKSSGNSFDGFTLEDNLRGQSPNTSKLGPVMSRETVANKSISLIEDGRDTEDTLSSQTPEISSQNSADSPLHKPPKEVILAY
ncbi:hypothetical protein Pfo_028670 [Paulownia fortunei]|nr:hypothetical protein Pfo_028670 [Paulownia fortunei]